MPSLPTRPTDIDAAWLTEALAARHPGARVSRVDVLERHEATNTHCRLAITTEAGSAPVPETAFSKLLPHEPGRREAIAATRMGHREVWFYDRLAPALGMRVPAVHVARLDEETGGFVLVMEDLAASGCVVSSGPESVPADSAARALEDLAEMHVRFEDRAVRRATAAWVPPPMPPSDYGTSRLRIGLDQHRERLTDAFAALSELYIARRDAVHAAWEGGPETVVHGDPHIGNLFLDAGRVGFLDWGLLHCGNPLRDVGYFLTMAMSIEDRRTHEQALWRHYLEARAARGGVAISFDEAWRGHRVQASYLAAACCQIVTFPEDVSPARQRFADAFLARAEAAIADLDPCDALRRYAGLT